MVAILNKSEASEGFNQIIDFLNGSYLKYALTVNPHIYVSCIKQFWNTVTVKQSNDVTRLEALIDRKKVVLTEAVIRDVLLLDDAAGVDCLPNEEIFAELAREHVEEGNAEEQVQDDDTNAVAQGTTADDIVAIGEAVHEQSIPSPTQHTPPPQPPQDFPSTSSVQHTPPLSPQPQPQAQPQATNFPLGCYLMNVVIEIAVLNILSDALPITTNVFNSPCLIHKKELIHHEGTALV
nr:xylulose kinase-1 [Tanacetum cinerariifolium]